MKGSSLCPPNCTPKCSRAAAARPLKSTVDATVDATAGVFPSLPPEPAAGAFLYTEG